jgi:protein required for attachment to host cells
LPSGCSTAAIDGGNRTLSDALTCRKAGPYALWWRGRPQGEHRMSSKSVKIGQDEWVIVCDGSKALFLQNAGDSKFPNLQTREVMEQTVPPTSEIGSDKPGRSHSSTGHGRSAVEQTDFHTQQEEEFLRSIMLKLDSAAQAGNMKSIILVAPPRALGVLRQHYTHALKQAVREEIQKDYVKMPVYEIEKHLAA